MRPDVLPILEGLFVTFLWSSSYILIKIGLTELSPFFFAAVRYSLASIILLMVSLAKGGKPRMEGKRLSYLVVAGLLGYTMAQGLQFVGLSLLPAVTVTFLLNFTAFFTLILGIILLREWPSKTQCAGFPLAFLGAYAYFHEFLAFTNPLGIFIVLLSGLAWASYMILIRRLQRVREMSSLELTTISMVVGSLGLLFLAFFLEGLQPIGLGGGLIIVWLSIVNTAFAFYTWNHVLKSISAFRLSILQNTMLVQIGLLSGLFLGDVITLSMSLGIFLVLSGVFLVQMNANPK